GDELSNPAAVEAEAVDHRLILRQTIEPLAGVARLRSRRDGPRLDETKAERERGVAYFRMLVEPRCKADRVGKREIPNPGGKDRIIGPAWHQAGEAELERPQGGAVGAFRIEEKQCRSRERVEKIAHFYALSNPGDTICSTAAAIANSRR